MQSRVLTGLFDDKNIELSLQSDRFPVWSTLQFFVFGMGKLEPFQHKHNLKTKASNKVKPYVYVITELKISLDQHNSCSLQLHVRSMGPSLFGRLGEALPMAKKSDIDDRL